MTSRRVQAFIFKMAYIYIHIDNQRVHLIWLYSKKEKGKIIKGKKRHGINICIKGITQKMMMVDEEERKKLHKPISKYS